MKPSIEQTNLTISIKVMIMVALFLIVQTAGVVVWTANMNSYDHELDDRITHVGEKVVDMRADIEEIKEQANARDIQLAQINTKLANIETLLIEIKQDIKEK